MSRRCRRLSRSLAEAVRASVGGELIRRGHVVRGLRRTPLVAGALIAGVLLALHGVGRLAGETATLRLVGLVLVLSSGFVFDDAAARILQASPYPLVRRMVLRIGYVAAVGVPIWALALVRVQPSLNAAAGLTAEVLAGLAVVWATAAWGRRWGFDEPGVATAPVLLGLLYLPVIIPRARTLALPVLVGAAVLLILAMRDPAARRWRL